MNIEDDDDDEIKVAQVMEEARFQQEELLPMEVESSITEKEEEEDEEEEDDDEDEIIRESSASTGFSTYESQLEASYSDPPHAPLSIKLASSISRTCLREVCYPHGSMTWATAIPLALCLPALAFTGAGSWDCHYFRGASISFTGGNYGLWTLQDSNGMCQLWDVLFFSYDLGPALRAARFFSMMSMLLGLALAAVLSQALQFHAVSWGVGGVLFLLLAASVLTTGLFNIWTMFFLLTYVIFILIVRFLFIHPVHRRISARGRKIIAFHCALCSLYCLLTLAVMRSDFCTCNDITSQTLEGRNPGSPCEGTCELGTAGGIMIGAALLWAAAAVAVIRCGVQPGMLKENEELTRSVAHYRRESITTRVLATRTHLAKKMKTLGVVTLRTNKSDLTKVDEKNSSSEELSCTADNERAGEVNEEEQIDEAPRDPRSRCKKACFDYRVNPRSRQQQCAYWSFRTMLGFLVATYVFIIVVMIGDSSESTNAAKAPDTSYNFITDVVCAFNPLDPSQPFETFSTKQDAHDAGFKVAHCGACGYCSNPHDIRAYVETRKTVADSAKKCGSKVVFGSYEDLTVCLEDRIGFTRACTQCWADDMLNTAKHCSFTCMTTLLTGLANTNNILGVGNEVWLNQCIFCDEKRSGPEFVTCSGVARRRLGIISEIERNPAELCKNTDVDWVSADWSKIFPGTFRGL